MSNRRTGRLANPDVKDQLFPVTELLTNIPDIRKKEWWDNGWWGDQGKSSMCVCYSWTHLIEDGPVIQDAIEGLRPEPLMDIPKFYKECQKRDPWEGEAYDGTSVRAGAKILKELNVISEYRWAFTLEDVINTLLTLGPMVVGTNWYEKMFTPNNKGYIVPRGKSAGGHAYVLNGVDLDKERFRIKNSWGKGWGNQGHAYITFKNFDFLLKSGGEACIAFENVLTETPKLSNLKPV